MINVLFDLDGTLVDPLEGFSACVSHAMNKLGRQCPEKGELKRHVGPPLRITFSRLLGTNESELIEQAVACFRERYTSAGIYENEVYPGISDLLATLNRQGFRSYVATSKPQIFAETVVEHLSLRQWLAGVFGTGLDGRFDNKADLVKYLVERLKSESASAVMIGDRKEDIVAGKANGTRTIAVLWGYGSREEIAACDPDYLCGTPMEIAGILARL